MEKFKRDLFGSGNMNSRQASDNAHAMYSRPDDIKTILCKEDVNGEFVPSDLEETVEE